MTDPFFSLYDIAYHYDALSILVVKRRAGAAPSIQQSINRFNIVLGNQVGLAKHGAILSSPEYAAMIDINQRLFSAFDWLHGEGLTATPLEVKARAIETDRMNGVDRPAAKRALQERWFPGESMMEQKIGYGKVGGGALVAAGEGSL